MALTIADFLKGLVAPVCVRQDEGLSVALELMRTHDYTQLPVIDDEGCLVGLVTSDSILRALEAFQLPSTALTVFDAVVAAKPLDPDGDIAELLNALRDGYAAVVVDLKKRVTGIITGFDASEHLRARSENIMLVEDIENSLKDHIRAAYQHPDGKQDDKKLGVAIAQVADPNRGPRARVSQALKKFAQLSGRSNASEEIERVLQEVCPAGPAPPFEHLTLAAYIDLILHDSVWNDYGSVFGLESDAVKRLLDSVRVTRNLLAHFRGDISARDRATLKFCADWLERHPPRQQAEAARTVAEPATVAPIAAIGEPVPLEDDIGPGESRYAKLALWLQKRDANEDRIELRFSDVEEILGSPLPPSAHDHRSWWANDSVSHPWSRLWLEVGWRVQSVNLSRRIVVFARIEEREKEYIDFFAQIADQLERNPDFTVRTTSPMGVSWHTFGRLPDGAYPVGWFAVSFARGGRVRAEFYIDSSEQEQNKRAFDALSVRRERIEQSFGEGLSWERLNNRRASRIAVYRSGTITSKDLNTLVEWSAAALVRLRTSLLGHVNDVRTGSTTN